MRNIDDMLKMIPLDEMGGIDMRDNNMTISGDTPENKKTTGQTEIKLRRGTSGVIAAALVLSIGAGAVALAKFSSSKAEKAAPGASNGQAAENDALSEADAQAKKAYDSIMAYIYSQIADGNIVNVKKNGSFTIEDLSDPDERFSVLFTPYEAQWVGEGELDYSYTPDMPESGQLYFVIDPERLVVTFVQWRSDSNGAVGQYLDPEYLEDTRTAFGTAPKALEPAEPTYISEKTDEAQALYTVLNDIAGRAEDWSFPDNMEWDLLPDQYILLDFDKREQYADLICLIEKRAGRSFTGQAFAGLFPSVGLCSFVEWKADESSELQYWQESKEETVEFGKPYSTTNEVFPSIDEAISKYGASNTIGCYIGVPTASGYFRSVNASREDIPGVEEWYEDFLTHDYEPVAFDESKKTAAAEIKLLVKFDYIDVNRREYVYIRTSDMEGANIYVNGRYYNVEDNSVLDLLDNGMPDPVNGVSVDAISP